MVWICWLTKCFWHGWTAKAYKSFLYLASRTLNLNGLKPIYQIFISLFSRGTKSPNSWACLFYSYKRFNIEFQNCTIQIITSFENIREIFSYKQLFLNHGSHAHFCRKNVGTTPQRRCHNMYVCSAYKFEIDLNCFPKFLPNWET